MRLTITGGFEFDQGGGILNDGNNLTLSGDSLSQNVAFERCDHQRSGGVIYSLGGTLNINGCQITGNKAIGAAGPSAAGDGIGGGVYIEAGTVALSNTTISDNLPRAVPALRGGADA